MLLSCYSSSSSVSRSSRPFMALGNTLLLLLLLLQLSLVPAKKDRNQPHPHQGLLKPYRAGPFPNLRISPREQAKLASGESVMKQTVADAANPAAGGGAICIQDIDASKAAVWNQILNLEAYPKKVSKVVTCQNYHDKGGRIKTKMVLGVLPGYSYESYYDHHFHPHQDSMTWTLDYGKTSDFDDVSGHWHLEEVPATGKTRVFYACDIKLKGAVPGPILNYISNAALKQATSWVKKQSEANPNDVKVAKKYHYNVHQHQRHSNNDLSALVGSSSSRRPAALFRRGRALFQSKQ